MPFNTINFLLRRNKDPQCLFILFKRVVFILKSNTKLQMQIRHNAWNEADFYTVQTYPTISDICAVAQSCYGSSWLLVAFFDAFEPTLILPINEFTSAPLTDPPTDVWNLIYAVV